MSEPGDERQCADDDSFGREQPDQFAPPDPAAIDDQGWLAALFARDAERMRHEPMDAPNVVPEVLTEEEFAQEILDGGADAAAGLLGSFEPGPRAAALIAMLQPASLSPASMVSVIAATEKLASWVQARQHRWLAAFACPGVAAKVKDLHAYASQPGQPLGPRKSPSNDRICQGDDLASSGSAVHGDPDVETVLNETAMKVAAAEVGAALHFSPIAAQRRVCQAVEFAVDLPGTLRALEAGSIDRGRSLTIAERTQNLPVELRRRVEQAVLPKATTRTPGQLRGIVDRAVISVDPAAAKKRHEKAVAQRNVTHGAGEDGMGIFRAELSADKAQLAYSVIDQLAHQLKLTNLSACDPRGVGALRADVFSDMFDQLASTGTVTIRTTLGRRATGSRAAKEPTSSAMFSRSADEPGCSTDQGEPDFSRNARRAGGAAQNGTADSVDADIRNARENTGGAGQPDGEDAPHRGAESSCDDLWVGAERAAGARQSTGDQSSERAERFGGTSNGPTNPSFGFGAHQGRITHLNVTIAASTLAGLDEYPGDLDGHGPIPADLARAIAASASTIAAIAIKPGCGAGLDLGRTVYRPRLAQRDHVTTRDQTCRFPGCRRPAKRCQIDHSNEFCPGERDGGVTCPCNLQCLCVFHHGLKTGGPWDSVQHSDASVTWTSPTGRSYSTQPRQWPTDDDQARIGSAAIEDDPDVPADGPCELPGARLDPRSTADAGSGAIDTTSDLQVDPTADPPPF